MEIPKEKPRYGGYGGYGGGYGGYRSSYDEDEANYGNSSYGAGRFSGSRYGESRSSSYSGGSNYGYGSSYPTSGRYSPGNPSVYGGQSGGVTYGGTAKPKAEKQTDLSAFQVGVKVVHTKFGEGTIVGVHGAGNNTIVDVAFSGYGIKQLSASIAPLTIKK